MKKPSFVSFWTLASVLGVAVAVPAQGAVRVAPSPKAKEKAEVEAAENLHKKLAKALESVDVEGLSAEQRAELHKAINEALEKVASSESKKGMVIALDDVTTELRGAGEGDMAPRAVRVVRPQQPAEPSMPGSLAPSAPRPPKAPKAPKDVEGQMRVLGLGGGPGEAPHTVDFFTTDGKKIHVSAEGAKVWHLGEGKGEGIVIRMGEGGEKGAIEFEGNLEFEVVETEGQHTKTRAVAPRRVQGVTTAPQDVMVIEEDGKPQRVMWRSEAPKAEAGQDVFEVRKVEVEKAMNQARKQMERARIEMTEARERAQVERRAALEVARESQRRAAVEMPRRAMAARVRSDEAGEADMRKMIEEMRAEMGEIRKLLRDMQQSKARHEHEDDDEGDDDDEHEHEAHAAPATEQPLFEILEAPAAPAKSEAAAPNSLRRLLQR